MAAKPDAAKAATRPRAQRELASALAKTSQAVDEVAGGLDDLERERALLALVSAGSLAQEMWVFKADPADPAFTDWMAHGRKTAGDSPYTVYLTTPVSPTGFRWTDCARGCSPIATCWPIPTPGRR